MENNRENQNIPENNNAENEVPETAVPSDDNPETVASGTPAADVSFSSGTPIQTVRKQPDDPKKSKLPVILLVCVLIIAIAAGVIIYLVKNKQPDDTPANNEVSTGDNTVYPDSEALMDYFNEAMSETLTNAQGNVISKEEYIQSVQQQIQEATTTLSADIGVTSPYVIEEPTTTQSGSSSSSGSTTAQNTALTEKAEAQIRAFFDRSCYIQGALYSMNEGDPMAMSFDGDNFEVLTNLDGTEVSIVKLDGKMYIKRPALKQYIELTDAVMNLMGISPDDFNFSFSDVGYDDIKKNLVATYDVKIDGKDGVCLQYKNSDNRIFKFYAAEDSLRQIDICDEDGNVDSQITISYFSETIPGDQLTLKGFTESSIAAMFADLM